MFAAKNELFTRPSGYQISRSVRFRASASASLSRTQATPTNNKIWTWSAWVKKGLLTTDVYLFTANTAVAYEYIKLSNSSSDNFEYAYWNGASFVYQIRSTQVLRDPSAWYHLVVSVDTTQATASNRVLLYVNGVQVTSFSISSYPSQNTNTQINSAVAARLGSGISTAFFDGYLTETNFVDGQALTPSSFGEYDSITGVWEPKKYTGTYGTNGFYLNFSDNSASTAAAIGKDYSGNGNNWTPNNISVTAGVTYDSMIDVPMSYADGGNGRGNYAVMNPAFGTPSTTYSNGNLTLTRTGSVDVQAASTFALPSGKFYWEYTISTLGASTNLSIGIMKNTQTSGVNSSNTPFVYWNGNGNAYRYGTNLGAIGTTFAVSNVLGFALDMTSGTIALYKNNTLISTTSSVDTTIPHYVFWDSYASGDAGSYNFGQRPFTYTPPSGFLAVNTQNLPTPTIANGASYMAATLYTGNAAVRSISNGGNNTIGTTFQPDFVWIKSRTPTAWSHELFDALRGALNYLSSNLTAINQVEATSLTAFNSNGFSTGVWAPINGSGESLVAWQWNAGGSTVTNTSGSISSQVRANPTAGFSIVTYTGTGATATVGHGLGVAPNMILTKKTSGGTANWAVYHSAIGNGVALSLNQTTAQATNSAFWQNTTPTSTVFSVGSSGDSNPSGATVVAYCFAAVAGYSAFGSYTGNASTDGPFVVLGFRPRWLMIKNSSLAGDDWILFDSSRDTYNVTNLNLRANTSGVESTQAANYLDFLSNGFKIRGTSAGTINASQTYIYMAFAENPFKYSLAR